ncbi:MAG: AraC family transcriptional regulator [Bacteroidales bacterium]|nr:AraC family transcriptional regulator [Bacteroidales bacterium]
MAGKKNIFTKVKGLFRKKEQAPSSGAVGRVSYMAKPISPSEAREVGILVQQWVKAKGYRLPHRTLQEAAENIGTDSVRLHRYCINSLGMDFRAWRTSLRVEDAKKMLIEEPELPSSQIARMVGVKDRSNFFRQFMEITGSSPDQWRQKHAKK